MTVEKLTIFYEQLREGNFSGRVQALFNPTELEVEQSITWKKRKPLDGQSEGLEYRSTEPGTLSIDLFFDTFEPESASPGFIGSALGAHDKTRPKSVLEYTRQVGQLLDIDPNLQRPPLCKLRWGKSWSSLSADGSLFVGVLTSMKRQFLLFLEDGTPVRAQLACKFTELKEGAKIAAGTATRKYTVMSTDTLMGIAARVYGDPSKWRSIADANGIANPRRLTPGRLLLLPKIV